MSSQLSSVRARPLADGLPRLFRPRGKVHQLALGPVGSVSAAESSE
jgi:hypothetical protein